MIDRVPQTNYRILFARIKLLITIKFSISFAEWLFKNHCKSKSRKKSQSVRHETETPKKCPGCHSFQRTDKMLINWIAIFLMNVWQLWTWLNDYVQVPKAKSSPPSLFFMIKCFQLSKLLAFGCFGDTLSDVILYNNIILSVYWTQYELILPGIYEDEVRVGEIICHPIFNQTFR